MTAKVFKFRDYESPRREPYRDAAEFEVRPPTLIHILQIAQMRKPIKDDDPPPRRKRRPF